MDENTHETDNSTGQVETPVNAGEKKFSQAELDAQITKRLQRQREQFEAQQSKHKDEAEQAKLAEQQQFKALAQKHEQRVKELEPLQGEVEALRAVVQQQLDVAKKDMPKHITALLDKMAPAEQLAWIADNSAELTRAAAPNINGSDKGGTVSKHDRIAAEKQHLDTNGTYIPF